MDDSFSGIALTHERFGQKYQLRELIGQGGMGRVYRALQSDLGRPVAIKVLLATLRLDPDVIARMTREAQLLAALSHPCVVRIFDFGVAGADVFLVMELIEGMDIRQRLLADPSLDPVLFGRWVLETACRQASIWRADPEIGLELVMAVNLSPRQFRHPRLVQDVGQVLAESGLDASGLEVEITEGTAMGDADATVKTLEHLKAIGIRLAIDDFGTGYSSLGYLKRFPIDVLKVDRSFVAGLPANRGDAAIVRAVVGLTRALGLKAVAEGVETSEQLAELRGLGCDQGQGYLFGRPTATEVADVMLRRSVAEAVPA